MTITPSHITLSRSSGVLAVVCECGQTRTHRIVDLRRGFPPSTPVDRLPEYLMLFCKKPDCRAEFVSPDDGVAEEG